MKKIQKQHTLLFHGKLQLVKISDIAVSVLSAPSHSMESFSMSKLQTLQSNVPSASLPFHGKLQYVKIADIAVECTQRTLPFHGKLQHVKCVLCLEVHCIELTDDSSTGKKEIVPSLWSVITIQ